MGQSFLFNTLNERKENVKVEVYRENERDQPSFTEASGSMILTTFGGIESNVQNYSNFDTIGRMRNY